MTGTIDKFFFLFFATIIAFIMIMNGTQTEEILYGAGGSLGQLGVNLETGKQIK